MTDGIVMTDGTVITDGIVMTDGIVNTDGILVQFGSVNRLKRLEHTTRFCIIILKYLSTLSN